MIGHVYSINCDCSSYKMVRKALGRWIYGPRCQGCGTILGFMQWSYLGKASGLNEVEIIANLKQSRKRQANFIPTRCSNG